VEIELEILCAIVSPNLEIDIFLYLLGFLYKFTAVEELDFQNLNKKPTVIHANICVNRRRIPILKFPNILIPTVPTINNGPRVISKAK